MNAHLSADGRQLTLIIPLDANPPLSSTGRSHVLASTRGWSTFELNGRWIKVSLTAVEPLGRQRGKPQTVRASDYQGGDT